MTPLRAVSLAMVLAACANLGWGGEPAGGDNPAAMAPAMSPALEAAIRKLNLPGVAINLKERCIDLESSVCLHQGLLELVACTKGTKEHESIVAIGARAMHVHTALLLLGAESGNPAMRKAPAGENQGWIDIPPRGGAVDVFLVFKNKEGTMAEHPISDFITRSGEEPGGRIEAGAGKDSKFPTHTFLFAGSQLHDNGPGPRQYLVDLSGNVISLVTFGDELLCLPDVHSDANGALEWQVDATDLPAVGTEVTLRLRPHLKPAVKTGKTETAK